MTAPARPGLIGTVVALNVGGIGTINDGRRDIRTAYNKQPVTGPLPLGRLGFPGDEHVYAQHGGADKAVCVYPLEHYAYWAQRLDLDLPAAAAFGENLTVTGLLERDVHLGDVFHLGDAVVQVTQPRAPCYKIAARYRVPKLAVYVQQEGYTGYLLRVLHPGAVAAGQELVLQSRHTHGISVADANRIINVDKHDLDGARRLLTVPDLPAAVHDPLTRRLRQHGAPADVDRLFGSD